MNGSAFALYFVYRDLQDCLDFALAMFVEFMRVCVALLQDLASGFV